MLALINAVLFAGYMLVYAAIAHGGRYASKPWDALREPLGGLDGTAAGAAGASSSSSGGGGVLGRIGGAILPFVPGAGVFESGGILGGLFG